MTSAEDYKITAANVIRNYVWTNMVADGIVDVNDYVADGFDQPLVPLIPLSDVPQFKMLLPGRMYIIWDFSINGYMQDFWNIEEEMTFSIISENRLLILQITNYLVDLLRRMDITAKEVEDSQTNPKFNFHTVYINNVLNTPEVDEGDILIGEVWIRYQYSRYIGANGRFS